MPMHPPLKPRKLVAAIAAVFGVGAHPIVSGQDLTSTSPAPNTASVPRYSNVVTTFDEPADLSFASQAEEAEAPFLMIWGQKTGRYPGAFTNNSSSEVTFDPTKSFKPGEKIQLCYNNNLAQEPEKVVKVWEFVAAASSGTGSFVDSEENLGTGATRSVVLGDLDGDEDLDLVSGEVDSSNVTIWNRDGATFAAGQSLAGTGFAWDLALGDLDGDGDLDLVVPNQNGGENLIWINDGSFSGTLVSGQTLDSIATSSVALGDLDGDGDLDLIVGHHGDIASNKVWLNDGTGAFTSGGSFASSNQVEGNYTSDIVVGDLDGDYDLDVVVGYYSSNDRIWINDGGTFTQDQALSSGNNSTVSLALGDLDGDGKLDLVVGLYGEPSRIWLNDGSGALSLSSAWTKSYFTRKDKALEYKVIGEVQ